MSTNPNIGAAARLQFIAAVIRSFLLFMFQWIVARAFGAGPFGIMNLTLSGFQSATALGRAAGDNIVLRSHEGSERGTAFAVGVTISLVAGTLAAVGLWGWGLWLANGRFLSEVSVCFLLVAVAVPAAGALFPLGAGLRRDHRFIAYTGSVTLLDAVIRVVALAVAVAVGAHWTASVAAIAVSASLAALTAALFQWRALSVRPTLRTRDGTVRLLIYSGTTTLASALVQTGFLFAQLTILTMLGRDADTGVFAAAARIALLTSWVQWAFSAPFTPLIAQSLHTPNAGKRLNSTYHHVISGVLWVNGPFLAGLIVSAPAVLGLFGPGFTSGVGALVILSLGQWANSATALTEEFLPLGNRSGLALATNVGAVALLVAIGVPLGSRYGITGVAFASAAAIVVVNAVRSVQIYRLYGIVLPLRTVLVAGASLAIAVVGFTNLAWTWSTHPGMQFAAGVLAAAITATIMWIFGSAEDRRALMALMYGGAARTSDANLSG